MSHLPRIDAAFFTATAALLLVSAGSVAADFSDRDSREIAGYVLTEAALAKYTRATANLGAKAKEVSGDCADDDGERAQSLDEIVARIDAKPGLGAAIQSAGMTTREYIVFSFSLFQNGMAAWALSQPGGKLPSGTSKANVDFYRAHQPAIEKLGNQSGGDDCGDSDDQDEEAEEPEEAMN